MVRFVVLTTQRSGSTFFCQSLDRSPQIYCMQECTRYDLEPSMKSPYSFSHFLHEHQIDYEQLLQDERATLLSAFLDAVTAPSAGIEAVGFKLMYDQLGKKPELLEWMQSRSVRVIHLVRENVLKRLVSWIVLKNVWKVGNVSRKMPQAKIRLEVEGLEALLQNMEAQVSDYRQWLPTAFPNLDVTYENFIAMREQETNRVGRFLGLGNLGHLASDLVKFNSDDLRDIVVNYDEVASTLADTAFAKYLSDAPVEKRPRPSKRKSKKHQAWSIGIYSGATPWALQPDNEADNPVLTASDVTDVHASGVADPFVVREKDAWYMFFEIIQAKSKDGEIGLATSTDGVAWHYEQSVLKEDFHVSYPYVFKWHGNYYMIPETRHVDLGIRLYRATSFPNQWVFVKTLLPGEYADASVVRYRNTWWLFALQARDILTLHFAKTLTGPWKKHPKSPLLKDKHIARPGGRIVMYDNKVIRFAQDGVPRYGSKVWALEIEQLTQRDYRERPLMKQPVLCGSGKGWNAGGMHHVDALQVDENSWWACVDGFRICTEK